MGAWHARPSGHRAHRHSGGIGSAPGLDALHPRVDLGAHRGWKTRRRVRHSVPAVSAAVPEVVTRTGRSADRFDAALAAGLGLLAVAEGLLGGSGGNRVLYVVFGILAAVPLAWRRRRPGPSAVLACVPLMIGPLVGTRSDDLFAMVLVLVVAVSSLALHADTRTFAIGHALIVGGLIVPVLLAGEGPDDALYILLFTSMIVVPARLLRRRLLDVGRLTEHVLRAELSAEEEARAAVASERTRLARELHDIIGHGVSLMVVQAAAAESSLGDECIARRSLEAVQATGREAIADLSRLLALLRDDDMSSVLAPQPGIADLDRLVAPVGAEGAVPTIAVSGDPSRVSAAVGLTVYRVVQEGLTNARRHAAGAPVRAEVAVGSQEIAIEVVNGRPPVPAERGSATAGTGTGLRGLRERVALFGGTMHARVEPEGGFALRVDLPLGESDR